MASPRLPPFQDFTDDLRIGLRSLVRAPVLTLTIVVTVGIGLGATAAIFSVIGQGMTVVAAGTAVGLALAFATTRLMSSLLFNVGASDPIAYGIAAALLLTIAALACAVPALKAMRLQPAVVLRNE